MNFNTLNDQVWLPSPEGQYAKIGCEKRHSVWLGGEHTNGILFNECYWRGGYFNIEMRISNQIHGELICVFKGSATTEAQLCSGLISQVAGVGQRLSKNVAIDRLIDFLLDQVSDHGQLIPRLSTGVGGESWITHKSWGKLEREANGCHLATSGKLFLHPAIFLQRIYPHHYLPHDWARRLCVIKPERLLEPPTLFLDISKPNKGINFPMFSHTGVIITGFRGGLESWAVEQSILQQRPYLQIRSYKDIERLINLLPGARLITPHQCSNIALGKIRSSLIEMVHAGQSLKKTA